MSTLMKAAATMVFLMANGRVVANPIEFTSGLSQVALVELYSSEGCSSCPPAEKWLDELREKPGLWKEFVPVEYHVTYWDSLGWKDRLSNAAFTERQYTYASVWGAKNVYTPCFVRNGTEWKPLSGSPEIPRGGSGLLTVTIDDNKICSVRYLPGQDAEKIPVMYEAHIALLGGGISSHVTAGENNGATLKHEFVVLGMENEALSPEDNDPVLHASTPMPQNVPQVGGRFAIAVWVTRYGELSSVQATGGWLPKQLGTHESSP